jgi:hypothetical protein
MGTIPMTTIRVCAIVIVMAIDLSADRALIFRITHRDNVPWILEHGLHCRNAGTTDAHFVSIGNPELISKRHYRTVPCAPGGTLSDYVPFYFTPFSPMMYNIKTGWGGIRKCNNEEIAIIVSSLRKIAGASTKFLFTDRHAYLEAAEFYSDLAYLNEIDWPILCDRDFKRDPEDPDKVERYQAEALIHRHLPVESLLGVACYDDSTTNSLKSRNGASVKIVTQRGWYF